MAAIRKELNDPLSWTHIIELFFALGSEEKKRKEKPIISPPTDGDRMTWARNNVAKIVPGSSTN